MKDRYVRLYDETFTAQEISGILEFYKTPTGSAMLDKMPVLISKSMTIAQEQMGDLMPEIQRIAEEAKHKHDQPGAVKK